MDFFAVLSFDIDSGTSDDYNNMYEELLMIGFTNEIISEDGIKGTISATTTLALICQGEYIVTVRKGLETYINDCYKKFNLSGDYFLSVAQDNWTWSIGKV